MVPMNWTLIPVCSNLFPSLGRIVTAPLTDSPSLYSGAFSLRPFSVFISTICRSSPSSRTMSISTGVEKKYAILTEPLSRLSSVWVIVREDAQVGLRLDGSSRQAQPTGKPQGCGLSNARAGKTSELSQGSRNITTDIRHNIRELFLPVETSKAALRSFYLRRTPAATERAFAMSLQSYVNSKLPLLLPPTRSSL